MGIYRLLNTVLDGSFFIRDKYLCVDPKIINYRVMADAKRGNLSKKFIVSGDWDKKINLIRDMWLYEIMDNIHKKNYGQVKLYFKNRIKPFNHNGILIDNDEKIEWYIRDRVNLLNTIDADDYKERINCDKIGVAIGRFGEILKTFDGRHRLITSKILNKTTVKVYITNIHKEYVLKSALKKNVCTVIKSLREIYPPC